MLNNKMALTIRACASSPSSFDQARRKVAERRQVLETARTMKVQRLQQDIEKIAKREREYARKLFEELVPVKLVWNEEAWQRLQEILPIRVEHKGAAPVTPVVDAEPVQDADAPIA
jgi:DNA-directed RNA polymerase subunit F